ncbi:ABC transporter permease [Flavihumibacter rivuli]|uniref:ABC transporter permease n=1 Tax=Flavihumibacter rivuli TaxID=2838156 RepID=UPI001BDEDB77|nr:ABC transporter permease [Flavihumibacter rivuli]ULQ56249.1 ABC transporter permease [Flavihumibacter rivuli]
MPFEEELVIEAGQSERNYWRDLWRFRELFYILSWRDIKVRYKQTVIGAAWSILRPLLTTLIFAFIFGRVAKLENPGSAPYLLMVFAGMLPWQFFANAMSDASNSLVGNANLITKVYFPRMIVPASSIITSFVDFAISFGLLVLIMAWYQFLPPIQVLLLPVFILITFLCALGIGLFLTALNVKYRDFRYIVPFIVQFGLYITPVGFNSSVIPDKWRMIYILNPMVGVIDGFRWCLLDDPFRMDSFLASIVLMVVMMAVGIGYFRKVEKTFADTV